MENNEVLKGAYRAEEFADDIDTYRETGFPRGLTLKAWPSMVEYYTIPRGQWSLITGLSHCGKSTWLDNVLVQLAREHGWKFLVCSPENQPISRHIGSLMEIYSGRKFGKPNYEERPNVPDAAYMTDMEHKLAYAFVCEHFYFIQPEDADCTVEGIDSLARHVYDHFFKFDGMVIDPYNQIEHRRPRHLTETDYVAIVIQQFQTMTKALNIHLWFVAHPTKPNRVSVRYQKSEMDDSAKKPIYQRVTLYDVSGSANWKSKCDFGVIVHRDMSDLHAPSLIEMEKVRFKENGKMGEIPLYYDYLCGRYVENFDQLLFNRLYENRD